jgi:hypothetical protein
LNQKCTDELDPPRLRGATLEQSSINASPQMR